MAIGLSYVDLSEKVLNEVKQPMTAEQIWEYWKKTLEPENKYYLKNPGGNAIQAIQSGIKYRLDKNNNVFIKIHETRPKMFFLKNLFSEDETAKIIKEAIQDINNNSGSDGEDDVNTDDTSPRTGLKENQLHLYLSSYLRYKHENRVYAKTIIHSKSSNGQKKQNEWLHPDVVGVSYPIDQLKEEVINLGDIIYNQLVVLYSFELKTKLNFTNLRKYFFQSVSNSSWANEGYLVAADISEGEDFRAELKRLSSSFGIGVIKLNSDNIENSQVLYPAQFRNDLDWGTINRLCEINPDFSEFLVRVFKDKNGSEVREEKYDDAPSFENI